MKSSLTSKTLFTHLSFLVLLVTQAYLLLQIILLPCVTRPGLLMLTSIAVSLVIIPSVYIVGMGDFLFHTRCWQATCGFSSGCDTGALKPKSIGLKNLSGDSLWKPSPTKAMLVPTSLCLLFSSSQKSLYSLFVSLHVSQFICCLHFLARSSLC